MRIHKLSSVTMTAAVMLFIAICAYTGAGIYRKLNLEYETERVRFVNLKDSIELNGIAIRREQLVCSPAPPDNLPENGSRIPCGTVLAKDSFGNTVVSPDTSLFFEDTDGFEFLKPEDAFYLTPSAVRALMDEEPDIQKNSIGRLVCLWDWYFAAVCKDVPALELYAPCELSFEGISQSVQGRIISISPPENGEVLLLLRLNAGGDDFMRLRKARAELIISDFSGLEIPEKALRTDSEGNEFVYTLTAGKPEKKAVEIIYKSGESCIAAPSNSSDGLKVGNRLIISGKITDEGRFY